MIRKLLISLLLLAAFGVAGMAHAADVPVLNVNVDHGLPITLSAPAASVFIANPDVADIQVMSPTSVMVFGKKTGETTLLATDNAGHALLYRTIVVSQDLTDLRRELAAAIPGNKIQVATLPDAIVLTGETHDPVAVEDARKIASRYVSGAGTVINRIQVSGSNQIMLRVRFAEVSRSVDNSFGIDWDSAMNFAGFAFSLASGAQVVNITGGSTPPSLTPTRPNNPTLALPNDLIGVQHQGQRMSINGFLDALQQDGLATILAEPNLTAMSGETANFLAGGQFPVPVPQSNNTISIQFQPYGISLEFTPTLIGENRINLHVKPEVSELSTVGEVTIDNITVPALTTRKAETTVELASGQSFAIAGLLNNTQAQTINKYPFLGDIPIIGPLFRSTEFQNGQTELVIVITPYIVKPGANAQAMALPMDGYSPPSEEERLLGLRNSSGDPNARPISGLPLAVPAPAAPAITGAVTPPPNAALTPVSSNLTVDSRPQNAAQTEASAQNEIPPAPAAAPIDPVSTRTAPPMANPNPPSGPDGFILE